LFERRAKMVHKQGMHLSGAHHGIQLNGYGLPEGYVPSTLPSKDTVSFTDQMKLFIEAPLSVAKSYPLASVATLALIALVVSPSARDLAMSSLSSKGSVSKAKKDSLLQPQFY
jgi:hypothetical protein